MFLRRFVSYIIDILFVSLLTGLLLQIRVLNPNYDNYYEANSKVMEIYEQGVKNKNYDFMKSSEYNHLNYELKKESLIPSIIEIIVFISYFIGFQDRNKGQTLGKKLVRLKVVDQKDNEVKWYQLFIRTFILYNIYAGIIGIVLINIFSERDFIKIDNYLSLISSFVFYASAIMIILRKDGRGIPDILAKTKITSE